MPPSLPSRPSKDADKISASWLCKLLDCVAYAMTNPRGDGKTILNESSGTLRALRQPGGGTDGGGSSSFEYPFLVEKTTDNSVTILGYNLTVNPQREWKNWISLGNIWVEVAEQTVGAITQTGYLGLLVHYSSGYFVTAGYSIGEVPPSKSNSNDIIIVRRIVCVDGKISQIISPFNILNMGGKIY